MSKISVNLPMEVDAQRICDLVCTAFEGGANYWLHRVEQIGHLHGQEEGFVFYGQPHLYENPGFKFWAYYDDPELEEGNGKGQFYISLPNLITGLQRMAVSSPRHFADWLNENDDAETGDVFMQFTILGEIVYG